MKCNAAPTSIDVHPGNPDYAGGVWAIEPVDPGKLSGRAKQIAGQNLETDRCVEVIRSRLGDPPGSLLSSGAGG